MIFCFISIILDLRQLEKSIVNTHSLKKVAYIDSLTGIPNRQSFDILFEKYESEKNISEIGCVLVNITNLQLINEALGRNKGNALIHDFATVFDSVGDKYGFVGRNGGNDFLIVMEKCDRKKMDDFLANLQSSVTNYNSTSDQLPVTYKSYEILNINENKETFGELIASLYKLKGLPNNG